MQFKYITTILLNVQVTYRQVDTIVQCAATSWGVNADTFVQDQTISTPTGLLARGITSQGGRNKGTGLGTAAEAGVVDSVVWASKSCE